jgi:copper transport protein
MRRLAAAALLVVALAVVGASPASAHAALESTSPAAGAQLATAPKQISLTFSEGVSASPSGIQVVNGSGAKVAVGRPTKPASNTVAVSVADLPDGTYVVGWRVTSEDSHPVHGAFTFRVGTSGAGNDGSALARRLVAADNGDRAVGVVYGVARFVAFAGMVVFLGGCAFVLVLWHSGRRHRRTRRLLWCALAAAAIGTAAELPLQGVYAAGLGLGSAASRQVLADVVHTRFGLLALLRVGLLVIAAGWTHLWLEWADEPPPAVRRDTTAIGGVIGAGIILATALSGHASTGRLFGIALAADVVHLAAISAWLGGLAVLAVCALPGPGTDELERLVPRFSRLAFGAVIAIVASGTYQSWRQVGTLPAFPATAYGRLLLAKIALFAGMVALGAVSRRWVRRRYPPAPSAHASDAVSHDVSRLRRSVGAEVAVAVAILAVTSVLVNVTPARDAFARPFSTELVTPKLLIDVTVDPAKAGPVAVHVYTLTPEGEQVPVEELTATMTPGDGNIGPIDVPLVPAGPGHYSAYGFDLPLPGTWKLAVTARLTDIDEVTATTPVLVRR